MKRASSPILFTAEDFKPVEETWGICLVGCFAGNVPGRRSIESLVATWGKEVTIIPHSRDWVVFRFANEEDRISVLQNSPHYIQGAHLILKKPSSYFTFNYEEFTKVPVWVKVSDIPADLWHQQGLSKIASDLGLPIRMDEVTAKGTGLGFARFLIEVDATKKPLHFIEGTLPSGTELKMKVTYESCPNIWNSWGTPPK